MSSVVYIFFWISKSSVSNTFRSEDKRDGKKNLLQNQDKDASEYLCVSCNGRISLMKGSQL